MPSGITPGLGVLFLRGVPNRMLIQWPWAHVRHAKSGFYIPRATHVSSDRGFLENRILLLCSPECPNWWFPLSSPKNGDHLLTLADCLGITHDLLSKMFSILNCNKKQYLQNCLLNYGINIPNVHVYHSKQSGVRTWLCFGLNPPQHTPLEQIKSIFKCPQTIYNVIRKQALDELPNTTEKPQCTTLCQGIVHHANLFRIHHQYSEYSSRTECA